LITGNLLTEMSGKCKAQSQSVLRYNQHRWLKLLSILYYQRTTKQVG